MYEQKVKQILSRLNIDNLDQKMASFLEGKEKELLWQNDASEADY